MRANDHRWVRDRLGALTAGLLEGHDEQRMRAHLEICSDCRSALAPYIGMGGEMAEDLGHIPAELIADWARTRSSVLGLERALIRQHLTRCAECRQDLTALGFEPALEIVTDLELPAGVIEQGTYNAAGASSVAAETEPSNRPERAGPEEVTARPEGPPQIVRVLLGSRGSRLSWALGGWAAVATVATVALLIRPVPPSNIEVEPRGGNGAPTSSSLPEFSTLEKQPNHVGAEIVGPAFDLISPVRGAPQNEPVILLDSTTVAIPLRVPSPDVHDTALVLMEILSDDLVLLHSSRHHGREFYPTKTILFMRQGGIQPDRYVLRLTGPPGVPGGPQFRASYRFHVERRP